jgi:DNA uptake protein ComE-like DNA-binding protein
LLGKVARLGKQRRQERREARQTKRAQRQSQSQATEQDLAPIEGQAVEAAGAASAGSVSAAAGAGMGGMAQSQLMNVAMTQGNAAANAAMKSANAPKAEAPGLEEEEEGGHATEEPAVEEEAAADAPVDAPVDAPADAAGSSEDAEAPSPEEEEAKVDGGSKATEAAAGEVDPPVEMEELPGGQPNLNAEKEEEPELGVEEKEGEEAETEAEGEEEEAEEGEVEAAEDLSAGVELAPLMPTQTPTLGVGASPALSFNLNTEEDQALLEMTGMSGDQHMSVGNAALDGLGQTATGLQAETVAAAATAGQGVKAAIEGLLPGLDQETAVVGDQIGQAFDVGTSAIRVAGGAARAGIDTASVESQAGIDAKTTENIGQVDAVAGAAHADLSGKAQTWSQSFDTMETGYAEKFEQAPEDASADILSRKSEIGDEQASGRGPGGAVSRLMDRKRREAGVLLAEQSAVRIREEGKIKGPTPVEEIGEPGMVEEWIGPLDDRVGTFRDESVTALTETATSSKEAIATGGDEWKSQVELDEEGAASQMEEDKLAAQGEVTAVGAQLRGDLESQVVSQESLFTEAAAGLADSYRLHVETVGNQVAVLPMVTGGEAAKYVADQEVALRTLHEENLGTLDNLVQTTTDELTTQVETGHTQLQTLLGENQADIETITSTKVESFNEMGVAYSGSLSGTSDAVQAEMQLWTEPLEGQSTVFLEEAETRLQTQHEVADQELSSSLAGYEEGLASQVAEVGENVEADAAGEPADETLEKICEDSKDSIAGVGTKENKLYNALRKIEDKKKNPHFAAAVESKWSDINTSDNESLLEWIDGDMDGREYRIAYNYYKGDTSKAAELELDYCTAWYNDDEAQIEEILRGLDEDQLKEMQARDSWTEVGQELQDDLDGTDLNVVDALLVNNKARADAYRLKDKVDAARRSGDHDALHDALAGMDPATRQLIVQEFSYIRADGAVAGAEGVTLPDWEDACAEMQTYVTRDIERTVHHGGGGYGGPHGQAQTHTYTQSIDGANENLANSLISSGNDSIESDVHRFEVERSRRGGPEEKRIEQALYMSAGSQDALRKGETDPAFQDSEEYKAALAEQEERESFEEVYAQFGYNDGKSVDDGIQEIYRGTEDGKLEIEAHQQMLEDGTNSPEVVALITELSTNDAGTKDERLQRVWDNLTPAQATEARQIWQDRPDLGAGKDLEDFFLNDTFSELSGDDARKMQEKMLGSENYMNDEQLLGLADLRADYQLEGNAYLSDEELNIKAHRDELHALIATVKAEQNAQGLGDSAYDENGVFLGTAEQKERYAELCRYVGITVRQEMAREDRLASMVTQAIAIVGAVVVIVLTGGGAAPLVIGLATLATGGTSIAANQIIKGDRYGYEQALLDGGITVASALTAGYGAHLSKLNDVAKGGTGIILGGRRLSEQTGKVYIALATDGVDAFVGTALNDQTWEESGGGLTDVAFATAKATGLSLAGDVLGDGLDNSPLGRIAGEGSSTIANMTEDAVKGYVQDFLMEGLSLTVDATTGKYHGDFGDALVAMNEKGMSGAGTSVLNEFFKRATPEGVFDGTALGERSTVEDPFAWINENGSERTTRDALSEIGSGLTDQARTIPGELRALPGQTMDAGAQLLSDVSGLTALQEQFTQQLPGLVALHPDVVAQAEHFESVEAETRTQGVSDDQEQAAVLEGSIQNDESPELVAQQMQESSEDKQDVVETRADEGEAELAAYVETADQAETEIVERFDAAKEQIEGQLTAQAESQPVTDAPVTDAPQTQTQPVDASGSEGTGQSNTETESVTGSALGLDSQQEAAFRSLNESEVQALLDYHIANGHKPNGGAGELLRDPARLRQVVSGGEGRETGQAIDLNTASLSELQQLDGIGPAYAQRIVDERDNRPFSSAQEMADRVPGVASEVLENNAGRIHADSDQHSPSATTVEGAETSNGLAPGAPQQNLDETQIMPRVDPDATRAQNRPDLDATVIMDRSDMEQPALRNAADIDPSELKSGDRIHYNGEEVEVRIIGDHILLGGESGQAYSLDHAQFVETSGGKRSSGTEHETTDTPSDPYHTGAQQHQEEYVSSGGSQKVRVDVENDPLLRQSLDTARDASGTGSLDERIALLTQHVYQDIDYDLQSMGGDPVSEAKLQEYYRAHDAGDTETAQRLATEINEHVANSPRGRRYAEAEDGSVSLGEMIANDAAVCREKALFMHVALAEMGISSEVVIGDVGVDNGSGESGRHAWVELADGTVIDGTWGQVYPGGRDYPALNRDKRQVYASPEQQISAEESLSAAHRAGTHLKDDGAIESLRQQVQAEQTANQDTGPPEGFGNHPNDFYNEDLGYVKYQDHSASETPVDQVQEMPAVRRDGEQEHSASETPVDQVQEMPAVRRDGEQEHSASETPVDQVQEMVQGGLNDPGETQDLPAVTRRDPDATAEFAAPQAPEVSEEEISQDQPQTTAVDPSLKDVSPVNLDRGETQSVQSSTPPTEMEGVNRFMEVEFAHVVEDYRGKETAESPAYEALKERLNDALQIQDSSERSRVVKEISADHIAMAKSSPEAQQEFTDLRGKIYNRMNEQIAAWDSQNELNGMSIRERALFTHKARETNKIFVRDLMTNQQSVEILQLRDLAKYGNINGPQFEDLVAKWESSGLSMEQACEQIVLSSGRSSKQYDAAGKSQ